MPRRISPFLLAFALCACVPPSQEDVRAKAYRCDSGGVFSVRYEPGTGTALLFTPTQTATLREVPGTSGTRYSDGTYTLWTVGTDARVEFGQTALYQGCRPVRFEGGLP